jgi:D-serine deaminase-like pyridoxal phosphate-dependent protein
MTQPLPARPGDSVEDIDTPALVVDLDPFERNLELMANAVRGSGVALRPHAKSHKCPDIARAQIERGAVGICCQKVGEAQAFVAAGIGDVLVTNEIVGAAKLVRAALATRQRRRAGGRCRQRAHSARRRAAGVTSMCS